MKSNLAKDESIPAFTSQFEQGRYQEFTFDQVFNDYFQGGQYKASIKDKIQSAILDRKSACLINFGPF